MITATEQSVAQNPAYRLATTACFSKHAVFLVFVDRVAAALHDAWRLHQTWTRHPVAGEDATKCPPDGAHGDDEQKEDGDGQPKRQERMLPDSYRHSGNETQLGHVRHAVRKRLRRGVDRVTKTELGRVGRNRYSAPEERSDEDHHWISVPGRRRCQNRRGGRANEAVKRLPR